MKSVRLRSCPWLIGKDGSSPAQLRTSSKRGAHKRTKTGFSLIALRSPTSRLSVLPSHPLISGLTPVHQWECDASDRSTCNYPPTLPSLRLDWTAGPLLTCESPPTMDLSLCEISPSTCPPTLHQAPPTRRPGWDLTHFRRSGRCSAVRGPRPSSHTGDPPPTTTTIDGGALAGLIHQVCFPIKVAPSLDKWTPRLVGPTWRFK